MSKFLNLVMLIFFIDLGMFFVGYPPALATMFGYGVNQDINITHLWVIIWALIASAGVIAIVQAIFRFPATEWGIFATIFGALIMLATAPITFFADAGVPIFFKLFLGLGISITYLLAGIEWFRGRG